MKVINYNINYNQAKASCMRTKYIILNFVKDGFSIDRIIYDKIANIEAIEK